MSWKAPTRLFPLHFLRFTSLSKRVIICLPLMMVESLHWLHLLHSLILISSSSGSPLCPTVPIKSFLTFLSYHLIKSITLDYLWIVRILVRWPIMELLLFIIEDIVVLHQINFWILCWYTSILLMMWVDDMLGFQYFLKVLLGLMLFEILNGSF